MITDTVEIKPKKKIKIIKCSKEKLCKGEICKYKKPLDIKPGQSQKHGFTFENEVRTKIFNLPKKSNDRNIHDIPFDKNKLNPNENISIKTTSSSTICCSDILRFYNYDFSKKNTIICIKYKQVDKCKIIQHIYEIDYNKECHNHLFGNLPESVIKSYIEGIKSIPFNIKGVEAKQIFDYLVEKKKLKKQYNNVIQINPKVDSSQSRVQCSITNFEKTLKKYITYKSNSDCPNLIRGNMIELSINSCKRHRNKK